MCQREKSFAWLLRIDYFSLKWNIEPELAQLWWDSLIGWNCGKWIMSVSHATPLMDGKIPPSPTASSPHPLTRELVISKLCLLKWTHSANIHYVSIWLSLWPRDFYLLDPVNDLIQRNKRGFWKCILRRKKKKKVWLCLSCHSKTLEGLFSCFWFLFWILDFCVKPPWLEVQITLNRKVNSFSRKQRAKLHGTSIIVSFYKNWASLSVARIWSDAYPLCKNAVTNPFTRDTEHLPKNVPFTTLRLNRKSTAFPQDSAIVVQSGACVSSVVIPAVNRAREINKATLPPIVCHPSHCLNGAKR